MLLPFANSGVWTRSDFSDLPQPDGQFLPTTNYFLLLAGGLALVLSRATPDELARDLPHARDLFLKLRKEFKRHGRTSVHVELLFDAFHEVSDRLDPVSRRALKECISARQQYDFQRSAPPSKPSHAPASEVDAFTSRAPLTVSAYQVHEQEPGLLPEHLQATQPGS